MKRVSVVALMVFIAVCAGVVLCRLGVIHFPSRAPASVSPQVLASEENQQENMLLSMWSYPGSWEDPKSPAAKEIRKDVRSGPRIVRARYLATRDKVGVVWRYYNARFGIKGSPRNADPAHAKSVVGSFCRAIPAGYIDVDYSYRPSQKFTQIVVKAASYQPADVDKLYPSIPAKS